MLWLLKNTRWLEEFRFGMDLLDWVRNIMKVSFTVCGGKEFQQEVSREFSERGIRPVAPERCVESWKKDIAKEKCINAKWPKPYSPVMLQTRPGEGHQGSGAFVMFSSWQDAMIALQKIAETKSYTGADGKRYPAEMVYENQIADMYGYDYPCRIILDCDAKLKEFDGKYSIEELCQSIDKVPEFFARRLIEIGAIEKTDVVVVYEKEKSREGKASRHYITNIKGRSTWETQQVLGEIFGAELEKMREAADKAVNAGGGDGKKRKKSEEVPAIPEPWQVTDTVPHHGRGQYSVLGFFDKKKGETEYPCITRKWRIVGGKVVSRKACNVTRAESTLKHKMALQMLHKTCYTCPVDDFITIHKKFMTQKQVNWFFFGVISLPRDSNSRAPQTVAGKKRAGRRLRRWTKRCPYWRPPIPQRRKPVVPAAVGPVSDFQDHGEKRGVQSQHDHALSRPHSRDALQTRRRDQKGGRGPHLSCLLLSLLGVQRDDQDPRKQRHFCGYGGGGQCGIC